MDRYEPMPPIAQLPAWLWRRTGRGTRIGVAITLLVLAGALAVVVPAQRAQSDERAAAAERARAVSDERRTVAIEAAQRPRFGRSDGGRLAAVADLRAAIRTDARRRVDARILAVECERFPRSDGAPAPERDPAVRRGRYSCLAVTRRFEGGSLGRPYRAQIDFATGRYAYCKITGRPDLARDQRLATPPACGGE
jgi:hypothetical protein